MTICGSLSSRRDSLPVITTAAPILAEGDVLGCVVFLAERDHAVVSEDEYKLAQTIAGFLGRHMES